MGGVRLYVLLALAVLLSGLAAILPLAVTGSGILESSYREGAMRDMAANASLFALALPKKAEDASPAAMAGLARVARTGSDTRFTVVSPDGAVLADSDEEAARMEDHSNRPEIREALAGGTGVDIRQSPTLGTDWIYVAVPMDDGRVVRAATSLDQLNGRLWLWWKRAIAVFCVALAVLLGLALLVSRALARPLEIAAVGADRYAKGDFAYRLPVAGSAETRRLSASLGAMAMELDSRFKLINRQREEMRAVFENMSEGVLAVDMDGRIMLSNGAAEQILHLSGEKTGSAVESAIRNADLLDAIRETVAVDGPLEREIRVPGELGGEALVQVHTARIRDNGEDVGVLAVLRDITRLRQLEIMRRDFVANVSHELRTPITSIQSSLETLLDGGVDKDDIDGFLEIALRNTRRMGSIIGNLLFLAGMESGNATDTDGATLCPVRPVLDEALSLCREDADARRIAFDVDCEDGLAALMNPQLIVHAVVNLVDNAVKYGPEGGTIGVSAGRNGDTVEIVVSDKGPGIAPRFHSRVFERFYRVDGTTRMKKGAGLGLSLVKHIALAQGGDIKLESEIGAGSAFRLILPY